MVDRGLVDRGLVDRARHPAGKGHRNLLPRDTLDPCPRVKPPPERTIDDVERGTRSTVATEIIYEQDDDALGRLPTVDLTPSRSRPAGPPRLAHALSGPTRRERRALRRQKRRERSTVVGRHPKTTILLVVLVLLTPLWASLGSAATDPALGPSVGTRLTEWARDHGGGGVVNWAENAWYTWNAPPKGGKPAPGAIPGTAGTPTTVPVAAGPAHLPAPAAITPFVADPTAGEGEWHAIGRTVDGVPTMYAAYLRPNAVNTSLVAGVAWMDTKLLSTKLYAGSAIPGTGQSFSPMAPITGAALTALDAAFNSGFRMKDSQGGFYLDGTAAVPLVTGKASLVIDSAGNVVLGSWGSEVSMTRSTVAVRQNLDLVVDNGQTVPGLDANDQGKWGATLGGAIQVWRSGIGVTADGALVYVGGSGLSIVDLANLLQRAGAVRAMELDINTAWVNFTYWDLNSGIPATSLEGTKLTYDEQAQPSRYFAPLSRDFFTMSVRPVATPNATSHFQK
jgi:hypothetical protein